MFDAESVNCVARPLLWIALGERGKAMLSIVSAQVERLAADDVARVRSIAAPATEEGAVAVVQEALPRLLDELFSAPKGRWSGLDVVVLADLSECVPRAPGAALHATMACLETTRSGLVRTRGPASERELSCHALFDMPAPSDPRLGQRALDTLDTLERWHRSLSGDSPLSRLWCWPRRGPLGVHSAEDLSGILAQFAQALFISGVRTSDAVRSLLEAPDPNAGRIALLSASALSLSVRRVEQYVQARLLLLALETLQRSATGSAGDEDLLLRETELGRLRDEGQPPPSNRTPEEQAHDVLAEVDVWIERRIGPQMGIDRLPQVDAALASAYAAARAHAARIGERAVRWDSRAAQQALAPRTVSDEVEQSPVQRGLVFAVAGSLLSAVAAVCLQLSKPSTLAYLWRDVAFPALSVSLLGSIAWLVIAKGADANARAERERRLRDERNAGASEQLGARRDAELGRFGQLIGRGALQRARACRRLSRSLEAAIARLRARLAALGVAPGKMPDEDSLEGLLPDQGRRVRALCSASDIARLVNVPDPSDWTRRVLQVAWPAKDAGGLLHGEAFADDESMNALAAEQVAVKRIRGSSPFDWTQSAREGVPIGDWLLHEAEQLVTSHDLSAREGHLNLPRHRLVIGPAAARSGQQQAFADLARSGWLPVVSVASHTSLLIADATVGVSSTQLRPT